MATTSTPAATASRGCRQAIADKQFRDYGLSYNPENEVMVASGATGGLHATAMALLNPKDDVLLFEPFYGYHAVTLQSMRVNPILVPLAEPDWSLDADALKAAVTPRTRAILLNTPANPSGKIFNRAELEAVAAVCIEHDLFLITDEIYEYFVYDGAQHICRRHAAWDEGANGRSFRVQQNVFGHGLAARLRHRRRPLDADHGALPRSDLCLRAGALPARSGRGTRTSFRQASTSSLRPTTRASAGGC